MFIHYPDVWMGTRIDNANGLSLPLRNQRQNSGAGFARPQRTTIREPQGASQFGKNDNKPKDPFQKLKSGLWEDLNRHQQCDAVMYHTCQYEDPNDALTTCDPMKNPIVFVLGILLKIMCGVCLAPSTTIRT